MFSPLSAKNKVLVMATDLETGGREGEIVGYHDGSYVVKVVAPDGTIYNKHFPANLLIRLPNDG